MQVGLEVVPQLLCMKVLSVTNWDAALATGFAAQLNCEVGLLWSPPHTAAQSQTSGGGTAAAAAVSSPVGVGRAGTIQSLASKLGAAGLVGSAQAVMTQNSKPVLCTLYFITCSARAQHAAPDHHVLSTLPHLISCVGDPAAQQLVNSGHALLVMMRVKALTASEAVEKEAEAARVEQMAAAAAAAAEANAPIFQGPEEGDEDMFAPVATPAGAAPGMTRQRPAGRGPGASEGAGRGVALQRASAGAAAPPAAAPVAPPPDPEAERAQLVLAQLQLHRAAKAAPHAMPAAVQGAGGGPAPTAPPAPVFRGADMPLHAGAPPGNGAGADRVASSEGAAAATAEWVSRIAARSSEEHILAQRFKVYGFSLAPLPVPPAPASQRPSHHHHHHHTPSSHSASQRPLRPPASTQTQPPPPPQPPSQQPPAAPITAAAATATTTTATAASLPAPAAATGGEARQAVVGQAGNSSKASQITLKPNQMTLKRIPPKPPPTPGAQKNQHQQSDVRTTLNCLWEQLGADADAPRDPQAIQAAIAAMLEKEEGQRQQKQQQE